MRNKLNIGLFGFGCVGYGLYHVLNHTSGLKCDIKKICVKDQNKIRTLPCQHGRSGKESRCRNSGLGF